MKPTLLSTFLALSVCSAAGAETEGGHFTVADIQRAIRLAREYLLKHQNTTAGDPNEGSWIAPGDKNGESGRLDARFRVGQTAHITCALLESGLSPQDARVEKALEWLVARQAESASLRKKYVAAFMRTGALKKTGDTYKKLSAMEQRACDQTYNIAFRALALAAAVRKGAAHYRRPLERDVRWLYTNSIDGAYGYTCTGKKLALAKARKRAATITVHTPGQLTELYVDASNSQYGLYGVWAGKLAGLEIPAAYWKKVAAYWTAVQNTDGGWGYTAPPRPETTTSRRGSHPSMTAAGLASLFVSLDAGAATGVEKNLGRGMEWFARHFARSMDPDTSSAPDGAAADAPSYNLNYYYLYGVERVALACGYRSFGGVDWYRRGTACILSKQYTGGEKWKGSWTGKWVDGYRLGATAYAVLFLSRGLHPVLFNKLRYTGDWDACPRDMANLSRWLGRECETEIHWRIVGIDTPAEQWHDAPILYITGRRAPTFDEKDRDNLRRYALQGGTIVSCPAGPDAGFSAAMTNCYRRLFPDCRWMKATREHPVYTAHHELDTSTRIEVAFNGIRPLAIHLHRTLPSSWQRNNHVIDTEDFNIALNLYRFVTDGAPLTRRGERTWPQKTAAPEGRPIRVVRALHAGNADPEPLALEAFSRAMANRHGIPVTVAAPVDITQLPGSGANLAFLTGTGRLELSDAQAAALAAFVDGGGTVLADPAGGSGAFFRSAGGKLEACFDGKGFSLLDPDHDVLTIEKMAIDGVRARRKAAAADRPLVGAITLNGRAAVFLSRKDITAGLVGYRSFGLTGYRPEDAFRICRNIAVYAAGATESGN